MATYVIRAVRTIEEVVDVQVVADSEDDAREEFERMTVDGFDGTSEPREIELIMCDYDVMDVFVAVDGVVAASLS